jgi:hypothetical protein
VGAATKENQTGWSLSYASEFQKGARFHDLVESAFALWRR